MVMRLKDLLHLEIGHRNVGHPRRATQPVWFGFKPVAIQVLPPSGERNTPETRTNETTCDVRIAGSGIDNVWRDRVDGQRVDRRVPLSLPEASLRTWVSARASIRCLPHSSCGSADIEGVGVSRIDRERVHLTAYDIIVGEKSSERPDGILPFRTSSRTENAESKGNAN